MTISTAIEGNVVDEVSTFVWNLACTVAYHAQVDGFVNSTILSAELCVNYLCVVLMDLDEGCFHIETIYLGDLYEDILDKYLQEEARVLMATRRCSIDEVEVIEMSVDEDEGQMTYTVRWNLTESYPGRDVSFLETGSLTL